MASASFTGLGLACILASLCLSTSALVKNDEHNLSVGERRQNDKKLFEKHVNQGLFWFVVKDEKVCFPKEDTINDEYIITAFEAINKGEDVKYSGTAKLVSGGVGKSHVCVYFEGYRGADLKFLFKVYGMRKEEYDDSDWRSTF